MSTVGHTNETQHLNSSQRVTHIKQCGPKVSLIENIPTHNRFAVLNSISNTVCASSCVENVTCNMPTEHFVECKHENSNMSNANLVCNDSELLRENKVTNTMSVDHRDISKAHENIVKSIKPTYGGTGESKILNKNHQIQKTAVSSKC